MLSISEIDLKIDSKIFRIFHLTGEPAHIECSSQLAASRGKKAQISQSKTTFIRRAFPGHREPKETSNTFLCHFDAASETGPICSIPATIRRRSSLSAPKKNGAATRPLNATVTFAHM